MPQKRKQKRKESVFTEQSSYIYKMFDLIAICFWAILHNNIRFVKGSDSSS